MIMTREHARLIIQTAFVQEEIFRMYGNLVAIPDVRMDHYYQVYLKKNHYWIFSMTDEFAKINRQIAISYATLVNYYNQLSVRGIESLDHVTEIFRIMLNERF